MNIEQWRARGAIHTVQGHDLFVVDSGPPAGRDDEPVLLLMHGYPTSSIDYAAVIDALARERRVIAHDHLGFGLSAKPRAYSYSCLEQADVALELWGQLGVRSAHVFAHDFSTTIGTELLARHNRGLSPIALRSITLCNGSVHIELAKLRPIQHLLRRPALARWVARLSTQGLFDRNMRRLWHDPSMLSQDELDVMWELFTRDGGRALLPELSGYLRERVQFWDRWVGALRSTRLPLHFLWGASDPIVGPAVAEAHHEEADGSRLTLLEGVGHYPMLEAPALWTDALLTGCNA